MNVDCSVLRLTLGGEGMEVPEPANDAWEVKPDWMTPAELMQLVQRIRRNEKKKLAEDFTLRSCPEHRRYWEELNGLEACTIWHYFRDR